MRPSSRKGDAKRLVRADLVARVLSERACCSWVGCDRAAVDVHEVHTRGRGGSALDVTNVAGVCREHHDWIHTNPVAAEAAGFLAEGGPSTGKAELTDKHFEVRAWISECTVERGAPSMCAIVARFGVDTDGIHQILGELIDRGLVEKAPGKRAALRVCGPASRHFDDHKDEEVKP